MIIANCFDQLSKSLGRQIEIAKSEAVQFQKVAMQEEANKNATQNANFNTKMRGMNKTEDNLSLLMSPNAKGGAAQLDLGSIEVLTKIQKATQDANELMRQKYLREIWRFEDLHKEDEAPAYVHRVKGHEVKHIQTIGENILIMNNKEDNIDVFSTDSPHPLKTLNIQGRQMNCSVITMDKLFVGCRDRRIFVYNKFSLELIKTIEVPESVHCMCTICDYTQVAVGMTDGHIIILGTGQDSVEGDKGAQITNAAHLRDVGGIWSICGLNNDTELALGTISGVHIASIGVRTINRSHEHYLKGKNIWNIAEYDDNKLICTRWDSANLFLLDRTDPQSLKRTNEIKDPDQTNKNVTDLVPLPAYDPIEFPFFMKRGLKRIEIVDILNKRCYTMYEDTNNKWGYNKVSMVDRGEGRFNLLFIVNEGQNRQIVKRYDFPNIFGDGLRKVVNLRHKEVGQGFFSKIFK